MPVIVDDFIANSIVLERKKHCTGARAGEALSVFCLMGEFVQGCTGRSGPVWPSIRSRICTCNEFEQGGQTKNWKSSPLQINPCRIFQRHWYRSQNDIDIAPQNSEDDFHRLTQKSVPDGGGVEDELPGASSHVKEPFKSNLGGFVSISHSGWVYYSLIPFLRCLEGLEKMHGFLSQFPCQTQAEQMEGTDAAQKKSKNSSAKTDCSADSAASAWATPSPTNLRACFRPHCLHEHKSTMPRFFSHSFVKLARRCVTQSRVSLILLTV